MKVIIAGSRGITDAKIVADAIAASGFEVTEVVSGHAHRVDQLAETWAREHKLPVEVFRAEWDRYGKAAGSLRNIEMAKYADALVAVWDGESRGTKHMIATAKSHGLRVAVTIVPRDGHDLYRWKITP